MIEDRPPQPVIIMGADDGADAVPSIVNAAGEVTEASGASIAGQLPDIRSNTYVNGQPVFAVTGIGGAASSGANAARRRIFMTVLTATVGGEIVQAVIIPAIAGYRTCGYLTHIWSDTATANMTHTFDTVTGLTDGLATVDITSVADNVAPDYGVGLAYRGSAVAEGVRVLAAAGQTGANQVIAYCGVYWGEPV